MRIMEHKYLVWHDAPDGKRCHLKSLENVAKKFELREGIPLANRWPAEALCEMVDEYKTRMRLVDSLINQNNLIVASEKLKGFLEAEGVVGAEFLPVKIINHKKRAVKEPYFVVNLLAPQDALDQKRSGCSWSKIDTTAVDDVKQLVLDPSKIAPDATLFRLMHYRYPILVREDLADKVQTAGLEGPSFMDLDTYSEFIHS